MTESHTTAKPPICQWCGSDMSLAWNTGQVVWRCLDIMWKHPRRQIASNSTALGRWVESIPRF